VPASPAGAGIVAHLRGEPPYLRAGQENSILWTSDPARTGDLGIVTWPTNDPAHVIRLTFASVWSVPTNYPSELWFPSAGCWHFEVSVGGAHGSLDLGVSPAAGPLPSPTGPPWTGLAMRPLRVPAWTGSCPVSSVTPRRPSVLTGAGDGPVFLAGGAGPISLAGTRPNPDGTLPVKTLWVMTDEWPFPVLIRGARIDGPGTVQFEGGAVPNEGPLLYLAVRSGVSSGDTPDSWASWIVMTDYPGPGC
jgi:hypothetical protein